MLQTLSVWFSACLVPTDRKTRWEKKRVEKPPLEDLDRQSRPGRATELGVFTNITAWHCTFGCITSVSHFVYHIVSQWHLMNYHWHSLTYLTFIDIFDIHWQFVPIFAPWEVPDLQWNGWHRGDRGGGLPWLPLQLHCLAEGPGLGDHPSFHHFIISSFYYNLSIYLSIYLPTYLPTYLSIYLSIYINY